MSADNNKSEFDHSFCNELRACQCDSTSLSILPEASSRSMGGEGLAEGAEESAVEISLEFDEYDLRGIGAQFKNA